MDDRATLAALDAALVELLEEASFAEAERGLVHGATLRRYHDELATVRIIAFEQAQRSNDLTLPKRDRAALHAHAVAIARAVVADVDMLRQRYRDRLDRTTPAKPGMRWVVEAAAHRSVMQAEAWWDGKFRLGILTAPKTAASDWRQYRRFPRWAGWTIAGGASVVGVGAAVLPFLPL